MIEKTISCIEERLAAAESLPPAQRAELQALLNQLRREAQSFPAEACPPPQPAEEIDDAHLTMSRLGESLTAFEASHPQITGLVNRISAMLANMGI